MSKFVCAENCHVGSRNPGRGRPDGDRREGGELVGRAAAAG